VYVLAALHAKSNHWNDCIILNDQNRVCDATIANVFWVKNRTIFTPPLSEGCVSGVMRKHLLDALPQRGFRVEQRTAFAGDLEGADEVFLTNVISGIRWVKEFNGRFFGNAISSEIYTSTF
jgi:branched-chain amino acid aminotransferase